MPLWQDEFGRLIQDEFGRLLDCDECPCEESSSSSGSSSGSGSSESVSSISEIGGCSECPDGAPLQWELDSSGWTNDFCPGTDSRCTDLNTTFLLRHDGGCAWSGGPPIGQFCGGNTPLFELAVVSLGSSDVWRIRIGGGFIGEYRLAIDQFDCLG